MTAKEFSKKLNLNYDYVRFMIQNDMFPFVKAVKKNGAVNYSYYFEPIETKKYIEKMQNNL